MKHFIVLLSVLTISGMAMAGVSSSKITSLGSAWKNYQTITPQQNSKDDINIVYGGQDISGKAHVSRPSAFA